MENQNLFFFDSFFYCKYLHWHILQDTSAISQYKRYNQNGYVVMVKKMG